MSCSSNFKTFSQSLAFVTILTTVPTAIMAAPQPLSPQDLTLLNRVTWGATETSALALQAMGREKFLAWQLHPSPKDTLPPAAQAEIDALDISKRSMQDIVAQLAARNHDLNQIKDPVEKQPIAQAYQQAMTDLARQAATRSLLRDLYSPAQLREQMTWFWFNHFNVHQYKSDIRPMLADYEETAIRPYALGRFRDMLGATAHHPAMLRYLDNAENFQGHINENYAREIMELHTMGVGSGYTQQDIQELARILTGFGIDPRPEGPKLKPELQSQLIRRGLFEFNPARHDYGDKIFLGQTIKGSGADELEQALDILARQPATAKHIAREMVTFFMGDTPPDAIVQQVADSFQHTDGDIAATLSTLFHAPTFLAAGRDRFKDPVHYVVSAVRLAYGDRVIINAIPMQGWLNRMAEGLYNHETPDGYAQTATAWNGPGQLAVRFEIARQIGSGSAGLFKGETPGATDQPAFPQLQNALYFQTTQQTLAPNTKAALSQAISPQDWNTLFLSSPDFMY